MDDVVKSVSTKDTTIELVMNVKAVCRNGGFKFVGNMERIINPIPTLSYGGRQHGGRQPELIWS